MVRVEKVAKAKERASKQANERSEAEELIHHVGSLLQWDTIKLRKHPFSLAFHSTIYDVAAIFVTSQHIRMFDTVRYLLYGHINW